jgi:hypothetical protein
MKMDAKDFKSLQWAIAFLVLMSSVGGAALLITEQMKISSNKALQEAVAARKDIQAKLGRARAEQQELTEKLNRFQNLRARGFIGPEKRLDWIEAIGRIKAARRIFKLDYEFSPQRRVDASILPGGSTAGTYEIMSSQMRMQIHVIHEGELLEVLSDLRDEMRKKVEALVLVRSCAVDRLAFNPADRGSKAQLKAECILEWITLKEGK